MDSANFAPDRQKAPNTGHRVREGVLLALVVLLIATNGLTLFHGPTQERMRGMVSSAALAFGAELLANHVIEGSVEKQAERRAAQMTARLVAERDALAASKRLLEADYKALEVKHLGLTKSHGELNARHAQLARTSTRQRDVAARISGRVAKRVTLSALRSAGGIVPKLVPYAGIPFIVTATGLDIADACEMLKDINELNESIDATRIDEGSICGLKVR